ncbi:inorganic pyrophosphatase 2-like [Planoprotostelium fungivorum]|uniref:Inorganic pyrophosphatase 2-like n=1 Tax=Planoprotostelium fungivorum TaxID=1890364 RepID=A0A2P6NFE5_9EUKA|nr:inorganic pyrophosphatase 2-like [Planoprotostelium fungivorum]
MVQKTLVAWDFDLSMIDVNSDEYVFQMMAKHLNPVPFQRANPHMTWPQNTLMAKMYEEKPYTREELVEAFRHTPFESIDLLKWLNQQGCDLIIISNANVYFIQIILEVYGILDLFPEEKIISHPASLIEGKGLKIDDYHNLENLHNCVVQCPQYMCKGLVLKRYLGQYQTIIYVGDSIPGDWCPCTVLSESDYVLARKEHSLHKKLDKMNGTFKCSVLTWESYQELSSNIRNVIQKTLHAAQ